MAAQARLLRERGHDVLVVAGRGDALPVPEIDSRHPEVEGMARRLAAGDAAREAFAALQDRLVERLRPVLADRDLVVAHNVMTMPFNLPLAAALPRAGPPVLAWTHDLAWTNPRYAAFRRLGTPWSILHQPQPRTRYVAISRLRRRELARALGLPERRIPVVPNGVAPEDFWSLSPRTRELMARADLGQADPFILVPVRITPRKRLELALQVAALLLPDHPRLRLVVSGPLGPHSVDNTAYAGRLRRLGSELGLGSAATFLCELASPDGQHPVDDSVIAELYRLADLVLLPSEQEGFGLPALEAALARAPLVCADIPALRETAGGAFTFPADGSAAQMAAVVERALRSRPVRTRRRVLDCFRWSTVVERMERVLEEACAG